MKRWLLLLLAALLILGGCDGEPAPETTQPTPPQTSETTVPTEPPPSLYVADSLLETSTQGAVCVFSPENGSILQFGFMGDDPVLFCYGEDAIQAIRIDADSGEILAEGMLPSTLDLWMGLGMGPDALVCYDAEKSFLRVYDGQFRQLHTVVLPEMLMGTVLFSEDLSTAYYAADGYVRVLDMRTGISRLLMQMTDAGVYPTNLLFGDSVLHCYIDDPYDSYDGFFSVTDGRMLGRAENLMDAGTVGDSYIARCLEGPVTEILVGQRGGEVLSFQRENEYGNVNLLPETGRLAEDISLDTGVSLQIYDPEKGNCQGKVFLEGVTWIETVLDDGQGRVWFLTMDSESERDILCRWDPAQNSNGDTEQRIAPWYTLENPDLEGLARCDAKAQVLEERFGVDICLYKDPPEPYDYAFIPEHQVRLIERELDDLEQIMARYPEGFFRTAASVTDDGMFHISLVRGMTGVEHNTVTDAAGLHYWIDGNSYIALVSDGSLEGTFYHELCHAMETYVLSNSIHFDFWNDNNPKGFAYDYSYTDYQNNWESPWLQDETRAFIDSYSMCYPTEDRARIMEYAMLPNNESYFTTDTMQAKLKQLCMGIREAFEWEKSQETFPWEQYLNESLAYVPKK